MKSRVQEAEQSHYAAGWKEAGREDGKDTCLCVCVCVSVRTRARVCVWLSQRWGREEDLLALHVFNLRSPS